MCLTINTTSFILPNLQCCILCNIVCMQLYPPQCTFLTALFSLIYTPVSSLWLHKSIWFYTHQSTLLYLSVYYIYPSVFSQIYTTVSFGALYTSFCVLPNIHYCIFRYIVDVRDLLDLVHNVILIECIFGSGKLRGGGFWAKGAHGLLGEQRRSVYEQQGAEVDGSWHSKEGSK